MCAMGSDIDTYLPQSLRGNPDLQSRAMVVRKLTVAPIEFIARNYLTGNAYKEYKECGGVYGIKLSSRMSDGDLLPCAIFTPTTKATDGHDEPISAEDIWKKYPQETATFLRAFMDFSKHVRSRGIIVADTKVEMGTDEQGLVYVADEFGTPDSSRFWSADAWSASRIVEPRKPPAPYDKQLVREWGITKGINKRNPLLPEDVVYVQNITPPEELLQKTSEIYKEIFQMITGPSLEEYKQTVLRVAA